MQLHRFPCGCKAKVQKHLCVHCIGIQLGVGDPRSRKISELDLGAPLQGLTNTTFNRAEPSDPRLTQTKVAKPGVVALLYKSDNLSWEIDPTRKFVSSQQKFRLEAK